MSDTESRDEDLGRDVDASPLIPVFRLIFAGGCATPIALFPITENEKTLELGRKLAPDVLGRKVSDVHAIARVNAASAVEIKLVSETGDLYINRQKYSAADGPIQLAAQDLIQLGDSLWVFEIVPRDLALGTDITQGSLAMRRTAARIAEVAPTDRSVFVNGESGSGKERAARAIHDRSKRKGRFVPINCAGLPASLIEDQLFGHQKGAFTGATSDHKGLVEQANGGTLFLDEIGDLPLDLQAKLLRVLQEKKVLRLGDKEERPVDMRVVSATHLALEQLVEKGQFRRDLYFRVVQSKVDVPALRNRRADIPALASELWTTPWHEPMPEMTVEAARELVLFDWARNNVRELENCMADPGRLRSVDRPTTRLTLAAVRRALLGTERKEGALRAARSWPRTAHAGEVRAILDEKGCISSADLVQVCGITPRRAQQVLKEFTELGLMVRRGDYCVAGQP